MGVVVAVKTVKLLLTGFTKLASAPYISNTVNKDPDYSFNVEYNGVSATVYYDLSCDDEFTKPFIYVEGFDPFNGLDYKEGFSDVNDGLYSYGPIMSTDVDFVYIDFHASTASLHKNKELVKKAIRKINQKKWANQSFEKNIVFGHSMGGLLARMALREMEMGGENHDASDYISWDAPHLGANIPLGYQYFAKDFYYLGLLNALPITLVDAIFGTKLMYTLTMINSPAVRQLFRQHVFSGAEASGNALRNHLQTIGLPQDTKNTAIANGAFDGTKQPNFNDGSKLVDLNLNILSISILNLSAGGLDIWSSPSLNQWVNSPLYRIRIGLEIEINTWFGTITIPLGTTLRNKTEFNYTPFLDLKPWDNHPAGYYNTNSSILAQEKFSFIPIVSALDIYSEKDNPQYAINGTDISSSTGNGLSSFDRVLKHNKYQISTNASHTRYERPDITREIISGSSNSNDLFSTNSNYNFGLSINGIKTKDELPSYTIPSGIDIGIQNNEKIGQSLGSSENAESNTEFVVHTGTKNGCNYTAAAIRFLNGSSLTIGDPVGNRRGKLIIENGSTVRFESGSTLRIYDKSELVVETGGRLIIEPNVNIILEGDNSVMRFMDFETLELTDNCIFKMDSKGHLAFHGGWDPSYPNSIIFGQNAKMEIIGDSYNYDDKILELHGLWKLSGNQSNRIKLRKGYVSIDPNQHISIGGMRAWINRTLFVCSQTGERFANLSFWGQPNITITTSKFHNAHTGIVNNAGTSIHPINIYNTQFLNCKEGVKLQGGSANINNSQFVSPMVTGIKGDGIVYDSEFKNNQFLHGISKGIDIKGQTGSNVIAKENEFLSDVGILSQNINLNLRCNDFETNNQCVSLNGGSLTMNNNSVNSFNNLSYNTAHILLNSVRFLASKDGQNEFGNSNKYISGSLLPSALAVDFYSSTGGSPNVVVYEFDKNRYSTGKLNIMIPSYTIQIDHTNQPSTTTCPPTPIVISIPNVSNASALPNVTSSYFSNINLMSAIQTALNQTTNTVISNPNEVACRYLIDILEHYPVISNRDLETLHGFTYSKMHETFNSAFAKAEIPKNTSNTNTVLPDLLTEANTYINTQIGLLQPSNPVEAQRISKFIIDKAFLNRSAGFYHYAEALLSQSENFSEFEMLARSQYWNCLINAEKQLYYGLIKEIEFLEMDKVCEQNYNNARIAQESMDIETNEDYNSITGNENHFIVLQTPKGFEVISNKWVDNELFIMNNLGQIIERKTVDGGSIVEFDMTNVPQGIYFIINGNKTEKIIW